jgi:predicted RNase H-like HicB family nuclease
MQYQVFVQTDSPTKYRASILGIPDCTAEGNTKEEAIANARTVLEHQLTQGELVTIDLETVVTQDDPWLKHMGLFADDPTFDDFTAEMAAYRQEIDTEAIAPS